MAENKNVKSLSEEVEVTAVENAEVASVDSAENSVVNTEVSAVNNTEETSTEGVETNAVGNAEDTTVSKVNQPEEKKPSKGDKFAAAVKEWFRKQTVKLKHKPQNIPFVFLLVTSFMYLCFLGTFSEFISDNSGINGLGIFEFINTLASILIILVFLNTFPKRKKMNIIMLVITFAVLAMMLALDIVFYVNIVKAGNATDVGNLSGLTGDVNGTLNRDIVHIVFLAITIVVLALLPVYKKLLLKINTSKELASNDIKEEIDTSEENG